MFLMAQSALLSAQAESENVPVPRLYDAVSEEYNTAALRAMRAHFALTLPSERINDKAGANAKQTQLRECLESLIWISAKGPVTERAADLLGLLCAEYSWSASAGIADDPTHPDIDVQAAETGVLIAWFLRRHGTALDDLDPRISATAREQLRRRLFAPVVNHDDYPFMSGEGETPVLIMCDILIAALLTERNRQRRGQPVKKLIRLLDRYAPKDPGGNIPVAARLTEACALADSARVIKRMTRGEADLTAEVPSATRLDDILSPYLGEHAFFDPCGAGIEENISGIDLFRLGHYCGDDALRTMGASMLNGSDQNSRTVSGRILSMEYLQAALAEKAAPPRLKRAIISDGTLMLARANRFTVAATSRGRRYNAGDFVIYFGDHALIRDLGGGTHSLPLIGTFAPLPCPDSTICEEDFNDSRDLISMDLTGTYPAECALNAYQRTLMLSRTMVNIRLVDAFEFERAPESITFRFTCAARCSIVEGNVRIGPVTLTWDGRAEPLITEYEDGQLVSLTYKKPARRFICGFSFDLAEDAEA